MVARERSNSRRGALQVPVRLHDASGSLAIAVALLKGVAEATGNKLQADCSPVIEVLDEVLTDLRQLSRSVSDRAATRPRPPQFRGSVERVAETASVEVELNLIGQQDWIPDDQLELVCLIGREAIRNVKRHSGGSRCQITLDASGCPYVLTARDWGVGMQRAIPAKGGLNFLQAWAEGVGASLTVRSQPGLGVELTLVGPRCAVTRTDEDTKDGSGTLRSVVAEESLSSRKRVGAERPRKASEQQIT